MKLKLLSVIVCMCVYCNTQAQNSYIGKIGHIYPDGRFMLSTGYYEHILTLNSLSFPPLQPIIVDDTEYFAGDTVGITGYLTENWPGANRFELEIETMQKWSLNQDIQRFLGKYCLECSCNDMISMITYTRECYVTIKKGENIECDLLTDFPTGYENLKTFTFNNAFFIPLQENEGRISFRGGGEIKNDSLFLDYGIGSLNECNCKGKKTETSSVVSPSESNNNKVYYDATKQIIVLDETLHNQSLTFELIDTQGKVLLRRRNVDSTPITVSNLSNGVYVYRLLQNSQIICSGKIVKSN